MTKRPKGGSVDLSLRELSEIKKLLILDLLTRGVKQGQIAKILGVDKGNFSRSYPLRGLIPKTKESK